jgi:transforming growth factor-beta-induced protein
MKTIKSNIVLKTLAILISFGFIFQAAANDGKSAKKMKNMTIVEIASADDRFSTLVDAVVKADLVDALSSTGPFTVFAPTNDAFDKLFGALGVNGIEDLSKEDLTPILLYHVVSGKVMSTDVASGEVPTLNDKASLMVKVKDGVMIDKSNVVITDIEGSNGVIHVIDAVLVPGTKTASSKSSGGCS